MTDQIRPGGVEQPADSADRKPLPVAVVKPRRLSLAWIVPAAVVVLAAWLVYRAWTLRGLIITVTLDQGHGLQAGDAVRFRGIVVGEVREVELSSDLQDVIASVSLRERANEIARAGSRFWVVRPRLGLDQVAGLETLVGPRYLAVLPDRGPRQVHFIGLSEPPLVEQIHPGDLEIILEAPSRGELRPGAPLLYRMVRIGTVLSVGLTSDGGAVEARVHIEKPYVALIRRESRFWAVGGARASLGITGISLEVDSLQTLLAGGIAVATPPSGSPPVRTGHRFAMAPESKEEWLAWKPLAVIGSDLLPPGVAPPVPMRATVGWRQGWLIKGHRSRQGWVLQTDRGLLGPLDLLQPERGAEAESAILEVSGIEVSLDQEPSWADERLALLAVQTEGRPWPLTRSRRPAQPEDAVAIGDQASAPLSLAAARLSAGPDVWQVDPALAIDPTWHGASVVARADGELIGMLLVEPGEPAVVALVPAPPAISRTSPSSR